jgi:hypothetical protein
METRLPAGSRHRSQVQKQPRHCCAPFGAPTIEVDM